MTEDVAAGQVAGYGFTHVTCIKVEEAFCNFFDFQMASSIRVEPRSYFVSCVYQETKFFYSIFLPQIL